MRRYTYTDNPSRVRIERILALLEVNAMSVLELATAMPCGRDTANRYLRHLHHTRQVHIVEYARFSISGSPTAYYQAGRAKDADRPKPMTTQERSARNKLREKGYVVRVVMNSFRPRMMPVPHAPRAKEQACQR